jgi:tetratricopeptide (TPR) repeat protein
MLWTLMLASTSAAAVDTGLRPTDAEVERLPAYCQAKYKLAAGSPEWRAWQDRIGQNFIDIHHYCAGLNFVNRYWGARSKADRTFYLQRAMTNFDYMVKAEKPDFTLRADLYGNRAEVFKLMGRPGEAIKDLNTVLGIDPKLVRPYLQLADLHAAAKTPKKALDVVTEGLRQVPDSTALQRRYLELGGQKPFPEPVQAKAAESAPAPSAASVSPAPQSAPATDPQPAPQAETPPVSKAEAPPAIGTPKNPYCRFCPPED